MDYLSNLIKSVSRKYNSQQEGKHTAECLDVVNHALSLLEYNAEYKYFGSFYGDKNIEYYSFYNGNEVSRPIRPDIFINNKNEFNDLFCYVIELSKDIALKDFNDLKKIPYDNFYEFFDIIQRVIYTAVMSVASCFDLYKRSSRKTPGTFFEILMAALLMELLPNEIFSKHIPLINGINREDIGLDNESSSLSTDIVIKSRYNINKGVVIPLKITTRERIVQPFAHQRILDSFFGKDQYKSYIMCISETQQDMRYAKVNHICVPGTIILYQKYLADIDGISYCDLPERYSKEDLAKVINISYIGQAILEIVFYFKEIENSHSGSFYR